MSRNFLLLTATVTPPADVPALARTDPLQRMADYRHALEFYLDLVGPVFDGIVFAENSNSDLQPLERTASAAGRSDRVEFLPHNGLGYPAAYGRGYGEMMLVDHAMAHSRTLSALQPGDIVWKCTGRYILKNIALLAHSRPAVDAYVHCRNYPYPLCEMFAFAFNRRGYEHALRGVASLVRSDIDPHPYAPEMMFRRHVDKCARETRLARRFLHIPLIEGVRGWNNSSYSQSTHPKIMVRRAINRLAPFLWI